MEEKKKTDVFFFGSFGQKNGEEREVKGFSDMRIKEKVGDDWEG